MSQDAPTGAGSGARARAQTQAQPQAQPEAQTQAQTRPDVSGRSLGELAGDLNRDLSRLLHQEMELAKAEAKQEATRAGMGVGMLVGAGTAALLGLIYLSLTVVEALDNAMARWLAALIVGLLWVVVAGALAAMGRSRLARTNPSLPQTTESLKEDARWAKERTS